MPKGQDEPTFHFEGFDSPNTTPVPDVVFDRFLAILKEAELKALLYIIRRTFGFKKDQDPISFNQFLRGITTHDGHVLDTGCGIKDRTTLSKALKSLEAMGIITSDKGVDAKGENTTTVYRLRFTSKRVEGVVGNSYHPSRNSPLPVVGNSYPQETVKQETVKDERDLSNIRKASTLHKKNDAWDEARLTLVEYIEDLANEFLDTASGKASTTRAANLFYKAGVPLDDFITAMTEARAITKQYTATIKRRNQDGDKTKMAYFFSVLEDRLGLKEHQEEDR